MEYEYLLGLIPLIIPPIVEAIKNGVEKRWIPFVAVALGMVLTIAGKYVGGSEFHLIETLIQGVVLGLSGVGIREAVKRRPKDVSDA